VSSEQFITRDDLLTVLSRHVGAERGITVRQLAHELLGGTTTDKNVASLERTIRNLVVELRNEGHHICAHPSQGYYIAATPEELQQTVDHLVHRALCSLDQARAMTGKALPDLIGQMALKL
jgi:hypothetical protein